MRERQLRAELALLKQKRRALEKLNTPDAQAVTESPRMKAEPEAISFTEHTARELR
jgi:hypothetical protein